MVPLVSYTAIRTAQSDDFLSDGPYTHGGAYVAPTTLRAVALSIASRVSAPEYVYDGSNSEMALELGCSRMTILRAMAILLRAGVLETIDFERDLKRGSTRRYRWVAQ